MNDAILQAALGGLLHDIGKFALRANVTGTQLWDAEAEHEYRYKHAALSADIAHRILKDRWPEALQAISYHHNHTHQIAGRTTRLVAIADHLSSGERESVEGQEPQQLLSIFGRLFAEDGKPIRERYWPLKPLRTDEETLMAGSLSRQADRAKQYEALWNGFQAMLTPDTLGEDGPTLLNQILQALLRYTWCIPSAAWKSVPDISLYDHSRMTAALAVCLTVLDDAIINALLKDPAQDAPVALLVGGDISGIQEFIYTITPRGATPALRGRSFYLQMLTEATAHYVLHALGLPATNLIYAGGGHFYLLAPSNAEAALREAQRYISRVLLRHHGGSLYLAMASQPLAGRDFFDGERLTTVWETVIINLRQAKARRFSELGKDLYTLLFEPWRDQGNQERECQICHQEHPQTKVVEGWRKCPMCLSFETLGDDLRRAQYLRVREIAPQFEGDQGNAGTAKDVFKALGLEISLLQGQPKQEDSPLEGARETLFALNDRAYEGLRPSARCAVGRKLLVNVAPLVWDKDSGRERVASNEDLAQASRGIKRLGVLRMDVDNLGHVFQHGLGKQATLSRIAALSLGISLYFEGYVETLAQAFNQEAPHKVYSIYSGGDDLFFVGAWDAIVELARRIHQGFTKYTGEHPQMHLSGGIVLVDEQYPIYRAAQEAHDAEDAAKNVPGKNAFCFLGRPLPWDTFERTAQQAEKLDALIGREAPRSLLRLLIRAQEAYETIMAARQREGTDRTLTGQPQGYYGPWIPRLEYMLARMAERYRAFSEDLEALRNMLREEEYRSIGWIGLAARWAELLNRKGEVR